MAGPKGRPPGRTVAASERRRVDDEGLGESVSDIENTTAGLWRIDRPNILWLSRYL